MQKLKKVLSIWLSIVLITQQLFVFNVSTVSANTTQDVEMDIITRDKDSGGNNIYDYLTGKDIRAQSDILVTGTDVDYPNGKLILKVPKKTASGLPVKKPEFVDSREAISSVHSETTDEYVITYTYRQIKGGLIGTFDFPIKFENYVTPNGDTITPTWEMQDENGNVIRKVARTFTAIASGKWRPDKQTNRYIDGYGYHHGTSHEGNPRQDGFYQIPKHFIDMPKPTHTAVDGNGYSVNYRLQAWFVPENSTETNVGIYRPKTMTFIDTLPPGGELDERSVADGWVYDAATHTATKTVTAMHRDGNRYEADIRIIYKNQLEATIHKNQLHIIADKDLPTQQVSDKVHWNTKFIFYERKSTTPAGNVLTYRTDQNTFREWYYAYDRDNATVVKNPEGFSDKGGIRYVTSVYGNSRSGLDGVAGGAVSIIHNVRLQNLDPRMYFNAITLDQYDRKSNGILERFNTIKNKVYGVKEDGTRVLVAEDVRVSQSEQATKFIDINDTAREYVAIDIEFPDTPLILDNKGIYFSTYVHPTATEMQDFKDGKYTGDQRYEMQSLVTYNEVQAFVKIEKNAAGEYVVVDGYLPTNATLNAQTGEIIVPKSGVAEKSAITAFSGSGYFNWNGLGNRLDSTSYVVGLLSDQSKPASPSIAYNSDLDMEIIPSNGATKTQAKVATVNGLEEIIAVNDNGTWRLDGTVPTGVSVHPQTGVITVLNGQYNENANVTASVFIDMTQSLEVSSRTPYETNGKLIKKNAIPLVNYGTNGEIRVKPYATTENVPLVMSFTPNSNEQLSSFMSKYVSDVTLRITKGETHYSDNWNIITMPWIDTRLHHSGDYTVVYSADKTKNYRDLQVAGTMGGVYPTADFTTSLKTVTLLPPGINYVKTIGNAGWNHRWSTNTNSTDFTEEPEVIENFRGTGRTAVIYSFDLTKDKSVDDKNNLDHSRFSRRFTVEVTQYAEDGDNIVEHFLVWDKDNFVKGGRFNARYTDEIDLDGDGDTTEQFLRGTNRITLILPYELSGKKNVSLDKQSWLLSAPPQDIGGDIYYRLNVNNNSLRDLPLFQLVDVLPALNDHKIIKNENDEYLPRGTQFVTPLVEAIEDIPENATLLTKFDFWYSTTPQGADFDSVINAHWKPKEQITNWEDVKAVRATLKAGQALMSKESINVILHAKIPYDKSLSIFSKAYNSQAISSLGTNFAETNEVVVTNIKYAVEGVVFADTNENGSVSQTNGIADEPLLAGYRVQLYNVDGTPYIDPEGKTIETVTDANGYYYMDVYQRGEYTVKVFKKYESENFTSVYQKDSTDITGKAVKVNEPGTTFDKDQLVGNDTTSDDTDDMSGNTAVFRLNPVTRIAVRNAGIIISHGSVSVSKVDETIDINGVRFNTEKALANVTFALLKDGKEIATKTTDSNGTVVFDEMPFGNYQLQEKNTLAPYVLDTTPVDVTISKQTPIVSKQVVNVFKRGNITLIKQDTDTKRSLPGVTFALLYNNQEIATAVTNQEGMAQFTDVPYGSYEVQEKQSLVSHVTNHTKYPVSISAQGSTVTVLENNAPIYNTVKKGSVQLTKVDAETQEKLSGVVFALKQGDKEIATATTDASGVATFSDVRYGEYTVVEKTPKEGYLPSNRVENVSIQENGEVITIDEWQNTIKKGVITLTKVDKDTKEAISGVVFALKQGDKEITTATTDGNGVATFSDVRYGEYTVVEKTPKEGYQVSTRVDPVSITEEGQVVDLGQIDNRKIYGKITLTKIDAETKQPLAGVTFDVYSVDVNKQKTLVSTKISDDNGQVLFENLPYGFYEVRESKALDAYVSSDEVYGAFVTTHDETIDLGEIPNRKKYGSVVLQKVDIETKQPLQGVEFTIYALNADQTRGDVVQTVSSDAEGFVRFNKLPYGSYDIEETKPLPNYVPNNAVYKATIEADGQLVVLDTVENQKIYGSVTVKKVDATNSAMTLKGVVFILKQGDKEVAEVVTDDEGIALFEQIEYGDYTLVEKETIAGYILSTETKTVEIRSHGEVVDLGEFVNKRVPLSSAPPSETTEQSSTSEIETHTTTSSKQTNKVLPKTGNNSMSLMLLGTAVLLLSSVLFYFGRRFKLV